jgi:hypothetical protein
MSSNSSLRPYIIRLGVIFLFSVVFVALFNEASYRLQKDEFDRAPQTIELVIPAGTAARVDAGQDPMSLSSGMVFVLGDVLEVKNQDAVVHQLGPMLVPPGGSARMTMAKEENLLLSCSFQASRYLGLDIRQPTTITTRLTALMLGAPTTTVLLFMYSLLLWPVKTGAAAPALSRGHQNGHGQPGELRVDDRKG